MARRRTNQTKRDFPRTARLAELLREILGDELKEIEDDRLDMVTITGVEVDNDLNRATVFFDTLEGGDADDAAIKAFLEVRGRLKVAIGKQAHVRKVPELGFRPDPGIRGGEQLEALLRDIGPPVEVMVPDSYVEKAGIAPTVPAGDASDASDAAGVDAADEG